jgi:hypothetical protein
MVPCWDCRMLKQLGKECGRCTGSTCKALEKISLTDEEWAKLAVLSEEALKHSPQRLEQIHQMDHRRLLRFARRKVHA